jgi:hypothetical protein
VALEDAAHDVLVRRVAGVELVGRIARLENHGVPGIDGEPRRDRVVPLVVDDACIEEMLFA